MRRNLQEVKVLHDDPLKNSETGKPLTPEELKGVIKVSEKLFEVTSRPKSDDSKAKERPWDGS